MGGQVTNIGGKLYYSSVTAGRGTWGTTGQWGGTTVNVKGQMWFPVGDAPTAPAAAAPAAAVPSAPMEGAAGGGAVSNTPIPISWGQRRIIGKVVDHIVKPLNADGIGAEILCVSAGQPLFREVPNNLVKIVANGTTVYDITLGGVIHPGLASVVWYDGTSDAQIQDPTFVAEFGADVTPGYVGQIIAILDYNSYQAWSGARPLHTIFIQDATTGIPGVFYAWGGTLDPTNKSGEIDLTNGNLTAERMSQAVFGEWASAMGTEGKAPADDGWYVYEYKHDVLSVGSPWWGGPGLTTGDHAVQVEWGGDVHSIYFANDGFYYWNETQQATLFPIFPAGAWVMIAFRKDLMKVWKGTDAAGWNPPGDPMLGTGGIDVSHMAGETIYPLWSTRWTTQKGTFNFTGPFVNTPPGGSIGTIEPGAMRNWGDVFVELGPIANLDAGHIVPIDITEASEGGVIYGGFSWTDVVTNAGKISNIDWWEDGQDIYIKQTAFDAPPNDVDGIPLGHRYVRDEDKGATEADRGGERRKPVVYELSYYDASRQFQQSMVPARSEAHESVTIAKLSVPFVMTAEAAATRSAIALGKSEMEMEEHSLSLPPIVPYFRLRPVDIVEFDEETRGIRTKVSSWLLDSDWGVEIKLQKLFTTAADPTVPLELEAIAASLPLYIPWRMDFSDSGNSGYVAAISGQ